MGIPGEDLKRYREQGFTDAELRKLWAESNDTIQRLLIRELCKVRGIALMEVL